MHATGGQRAGRRLLRSATSSTLITFVPDKPGEYAFNGSMGMMTPDSKIIVTSNGKG